MYVGWLIFDGQIIVSSEQMYPPWGRRIPLISQTTDFHGLHGLRINCSHRAHREHREFIDTQIDADGRRFFRSALCTRDALLAKQACPQCPASSTESPAGRPGLPFGADLEQTMSECEVVGKILNARFCR